jgi:hypothetical protein
VQEGGPEKVVRPERIPSLFAKLFILLASPTVSSLNHIADVMRQAQPLYDECRSILNYIDGNHSADEPQSSDDSVLRRESGAANNDAPCTSHTVIEPGSKYCKNVM